MDAIALSFTAFGFGVLHALEPGHGKVLSASTLIGSQRRWRDPVLLALSTACGHAVGIVLFATLAFTLTQGLAGEELRRVAELGAGGIILCIGIALLVTLRKRGTPTTAEPVCASCSCQERTRHIPIIGFLIGIVPCPSALAITFTATKMGSLTQTRALSLTFACGVAITLAVIGVAVTHSTTRIKEMMNRSHPFIRALPFVSPVLISVLGSVMIPHAALE